jgi:hypothetical protein
MSLIALHSDTQISTDVARIVNHFKIPLSVKQTASIGLVGLSFQKRPEFEIIAGENDRLIFRLGQEGPKQWGQQLLVVLDEGIYLGSELATEISTQLQNILPVGGWSLTCTYNTNFSTFSIIVVQDPGVETNITTMGAFIEAASGNVGFTNNGTNKVTVSTPTYTSSTSFTDATTDQLVISGSQLKGDGDQENGIDTDLTGGLFTVEIPPQKDNGGAGLGSGTHIVGLLPYWQKNGAVNQQVQLGDEFQPFSFKVSSDIGAVKSKTQISLYLQTKSTTISPPLGGWEGTSTIIFADVDVTALSSIPGLGLTDWSVAYKHLTDHVYVQIEVERFSEISIWIWFDDQGDGQVLEKQKIIVSGESSNLIKFEHPFKSIDFPLYGTLQSSSGNVDTSSTALVSGTFDTIDRTNEVVVTAKQVGDFLDPTEMSLGFQSALQLTHLFKFSRVGSDDKPPLDNFDISNNIGIANLGRTLGMPAYFKDTNPTDFYGITSTVASAESLVIPDIHVELGSYNIIALRGKLSDIGRIVAVLPAEEISSNLQKGTIHYNTSTPIMINLNLSKDESLSDMTVNLRNSDGTLLKNLINKSTCTFIIKD